MAAEDEVPEDPAERNGSEETDATADPRADPPPLAEVPHLFAEGVARYNDGQYWEAHESWEEAWHALRAKHRADDARFLRGLILATAALENLSRKKPAGFQRQMAKALKRLRAHRGRGRTVLGLLGEDALREALVDLFLDAMTVRHLEGMDDLSYAPPRIEADPDDADPGGSAAAGPDAG